MTVYNITVTYWSNEKHKFVKRDFLVREESEDAARNRVFTWFYKMLGLPLHITGMDIKKS